MILLKSSAEIQKMASTGKIVAKALKTAEESIHAGMSTMELNDLIEKVILSMGAIPSFKNYRGFPSCCCISPNSVVVHGIPSKKIILKDGDIVSVDVGAFFDGFHADAARTFPVGNISQDAKRLIDVTKQSFFDGAAHAVVGNRLGDISYAVQKTAEDAGFSVVRELVGHGIGRNLHEEPDVPNFGRANHGIRLCSGMVIAIEPMINQGVRNVNFSKEDGWTVSTVDGKLSAHYENTVAITENGPMFLTLEE